MREIWILLWTTTGTWCDTAYIEMQDRYSIRSSSPAIVEWANILRKRGKIFEDQFGIFKAEAFDVVESTDGIVRLKP